MKFINQTISAWVLISERIDNIFVDEIEFLSVVGCQNLLGLLVAEARVRIVWRNRQIYGRGLAFQPDHNVTGRN